MDRFPKLRKYKLFTVMVTCALFFLLGLTLTTDVSNYYVVIIITPYIYSTVVYVPSFGTTWNIYWEILNFVKLGKKIFLDLFRGSEKCHIVNFYSRCNCCSYPENIVFTFMRKDTRMTGRGTICNGWRFHVLKKTCNVFCIGCVFRFLF